MKPIATRRIPAYPKNTQAQTQYWDIETEDENYIYKWLYTFLADMNETATHEPDLQRDWFRRRPDLYPKGQRGPNSHASILGGICGAKLRDAKKNLSTSQLDVVEYLFCIIAQHYAGEASAPEAIVFDRRLFTIE
jgi:hypothetical protein